MTRDRFVDIIFIMIVVTIWFTCGYFIGEKSRAEETSSQYRQGYSDCSGYVGKRLENILENFNEIGP